MEGLNINCPYCGRATDFVTSEEFYGRNYGTHLYVCRPCNAYVGTHKGSNRPLGTLADWETREWRKMAHAQFDPLWKRGKRSRTGAYIWMQKVMGLTPEEAHIGNFNIQQCRQLIREIHKWRGF